MRDSYPSIEEMRPGEIQARAGNASSIAFVPLAPLHEWHSWHLPLGTDGLMAEALAHILAQKTEGVYFRAMSLALDEWRSAESKKKWGIPEPAEVFGMNFPGLPVASEYQTAEVMRACLDARLKAVKNSGFRRACLINNHGGVGQVETVAAMADKWRTADFTVHAIPFVTTFNKFTPADNLAYQLQVGGHAGLRETIVVLAFRPELVDLSCLPEGPLRVAAFGMLYKEPVIPAEYNPRHTVATLAAELKKSIVENSLAFIREKFGLAPASSGRECQ